MKRLVAFCLVLLIGCSLVGCSTTVEVENDPNNRVTSTDNIYIEIWIDEETGVQYIIYDRVGGYAGRGGITPRLNSDGSLYGFNVETNTLEQIEWSVSDGYYQNNSCS